MFSAYSRSPKKPTMQLVPILLLGASAFYSLIASIFWFIRFGINHTSAPLYLIQGLFDGLFFSSVQIILLVTALIFSVIVLVTKKYSSRSFSVGMVFVTAVFSMAQAIRLITAIRGNI